MWASLEGLVIGGRYELGEHIATGGMAVVFRGWDHRVQRPVAIKMLRQLERADRPAVTRFRREAHAVAMLNHPKVVRAYDFFEEYGCSYLVMELVDGINLKQRLRGQGPLPQLEAIEVALQVCDALAAAHAQGFIHRDVKPQNILLDPSGAAKVADFGIVHITRGATLTTDGTVLGTADYIAPEQARGEALTPATDVYALGVVLYEMLTGRVPFTGPSPMAVATQHACEPVPPPSRVQPTISPYVESVVLRALHKQPCRRYQTATAFAVALQQVRDVLLGTSAAPLELTASHPSGPLATPTAVPALAGVAAAAIAPAEALQSQPVSAASSAVAEREYVTDAGESWRDVAAILLASAASAASPSANGAEVGVVMREPVSAPGAVSIEPGTQASWLRLALVALISLALLGATLGLELWFNVHSAGMTLLPLP
jgi:eukaryotic-like serine/threonine-protein kinase